MKQSLELPHNKDLSSSSQTCSYLLLFLHPVFPVQSYLYSYHHCPLAPLYWLSRIHWPLQWNLHLVSFPHLSSPLQHTRSVGIKTNTQSHIRILSPHIFQPVIPQSLQTYTADKLLPPSISSSPSHFQHPAASTDFKA